MIDGGCVYRSIGNQASHLFGDYLNTTLQPQPQHLDSSSFNGQDSLNQVKIWRSVPTTSLDGLVSIKKHSHQKRKEELAKQTSLFDCYGFYRTWLAHKLCLNLHTGCVSFVVGAKQSSEWSAQEFVLPSPLVVSTPLGESPPIVCTMSPSSIFSQGHECQRRVRYWARWGSNSYLEYDKNFAFSPQRFFAEKYVDKSWIVRFMQN